MSGNFCGVHPTTTTTRDPLTFPTVEGKSQRCISINLRGEFHEEVFPCADDDDSDIRRVLGSRHSEKSRD